MGEINQGKGNRACLRGGVSHSEKVFWAVLTAS